MSAATRNRPPSTQDRIVETLKEVGVARLDDLAEHLELHEGTIRRGADGLAAQGKINVLPGKKGRGGHKPEYSYGDGSPEQGVEPDPLEALGPPFGQQGMRRERDDG